GCSGGDPDLATPDDCTTPDNEGCTARALCGPTAPPFPHPAGPGVAYARHDGGVGTVDGDLTYTELLPMGAVFGTSEDGRAVVENGDFASGEVSVLHADGTVGPSWGARGFESAAVTAAGRILLATSNPHIAYVEGLALEGEGQIALAALTGSGGV